VTLMPLAPTRVVRTFRYGVLFDGVDDRAEVSDSPSIRLTSNMAFDLWFKILSTKYTGSNIMLRKGAYPNRQYELVVGWGSRRFIAGADGSQYIIPPVGSLDKFVGEWVHACYNRNNDEGWAELRFNFDELVGRRIFTPGTTEPSDTKPLDLATYVNCLINAVHVYGQVLSNDEIYYNYNNPDDPVSNGLVLSLHAHPDYIKDIDGDGILEWIDLSGNNNHAKLYGATLVEIVKSPARVLAPARIRAPAR